MKEDFSADDFEVVDIFKNEFVTYLSSKPVTHVRREKVGDGTVDKEISEDKSLSISDLSVKWALDERLWQQINVPYFLLDFGHLESISFLIRQNMPELPRSLRLSKKRVRSWEDFAKLVEFLRASLFDAINSGSVVSATMPRGGQPACLRESAVAWARERGYIVKAMMPIAIPELNSNDNFDHDPEWQRQANAKAADLFEKSGKHPTKEKVAKLLAEELSKTPGTVKRRIKNFWDPNSKGPRKKKPNA
jgi:hypothetical protein